VVNGEICPAREATIAATDDGLFRGDGVYEVIRVYRGRPFALAEHLDRLERSCFTLRLECARQVVEQEISQLLTMCGPKTCDLRIVFTRANQRLVLLEPLREVGGFLRLGFVTYAPTQILDQAKTLSYAANMLASRLARERGYDEALLVNPQGQVLEAPTASFFWVTNNGRLSTPPLSDHILDSITRRVVMRVVQVEERSCTTADALSCDEAFLASTTREVQPVVAIEEHQIGAPGQITRDVMTSFQSYISASAQFSR
jgi:branched-chain amino acid aminotransferase